MMDPELRLVYDVVHRLHWDSTFRAVFLSDGERALEDNYPDQNLWRFLRLASRAGIEEDAYRRHASLRRTCAEVWPRGHLVISATCGQTFYDDVLLSMWTHFMGDQGDPRRDRILDPFDGYVVGPIVRDVARRSFRADSSWLLDLVEYEWAVWHAYRVLMGWPPVEQFPPLIAGASLFESACDMDSLLVEIDRLRRSSADETLYRWRIQPSPGRFRRIVLPKDGKVAQIAMSDSDFEEIAATVAATTTCLNPLLSEAVQGVGMFVDNAFLCCPDELRDVRPPAEAFADVVEYGPH